MHRAVRRPDISRLVAARRPNAAFKQRIRATHRLTSRRHCADSDDLIRGWLWHMADYTIDGAAVVAAERLFGIQYSAAERAQMLDNLADQIELGGASSSGEAPQFAAASDGVRSATPRIHDARAVADEHPAGCTSVYRRMTRTSSIAPVGHLSAWIAGGQLTSVRLTRVYLDRIRRHDPALLSFATVTEALALAQAERADTLLAEGKWLSPLHGIPYAAKDILDTAGIITGWGAEPFAKRIPQTDAEVVRRLALLARFCSGKPAWVPWRSVTSGMAARRAIPGTQRKDRAVRARAPQPPRRPVSRRSRLGLRR